MDKKELRKMVLQVREALDKNQSRVKSEIISQRILNLPQYQKATCVFTFIPFGHEVDIRPVLEDGIKQGKRMVIPKTFTKEKYIATYEFTDWNQLVAGVYGILEPDPGKAIEVRPDEIDFIVIPGVAFDRMGGRLGYGGGFYDRFLSNYDRLPSLVAVCFQEQLVERIPMKPHDFKVDYIITDVEMIDCRKINK
ncbi:MAG TPA: 5-formyltetrahydrofolate cyclo-ligase [Bacillota bacterium]|nr:5-formyltetrahydrofolate cyclo-ligase [Bacillota bacterium]